MSWFNYLALAQPWPPSFVGLYDVTVEEPTTFIDEFQPFEMGDYYRTVNLMHGRRTQERMRVDRWSNVRRRKRSAELKQRKGAP